MWRSFSDNAEEFLECEVIRIGCCYDLPSEDATEEASYPGGFPMSKKSAERWRGMGKVAGLHNFKLHAFRAAFHMYYPDTLTKSPAVGRQGKALRCQQHRRILESNLNHEDLGNFCATLSGKLSKDEGSWPPMACSETQNAEKKGSLREGDAFKSSYGIFIYEAASSIDKYSLFVKFCKSGLAHFDLLHLQDIDLHQLWEETKPFIGLIAPYWSIRAALRPILETFLLLFRLLFLQEQGNILEAVIIPIFDPILSPRNMAFIAKKV